MTYFDIPGLRVKICLKTANGRSTGPIAGYTQGGYACRSATAKLSSCQRRSDQGNNLCITSIQFCYGVGSGVLIQTQSEDCTPRFKAWEIQKPSRLHCAERKQAPGNDLRTS